MKSEIKIVSNKLKLNLDLQSEDLISLSLKADTTNDLNNLDVLLTSLILSSKLDRENLIYPLLRALFISFVKIEGFKKEFIKILKVVNKYDDSFSKNSLNEFLDSFDFLEELDIDINLLKRELSVIFNEIQEDSNIKISEYINDVNTLKSDINQSKKISLISNDEIENIKNSHSNIEQSEEELKISTLVKNTKILNKFKN